MRWIWIIVLLCFTQCTQRVVKLNIQSDGKVVIIDSISLDNKITPANFNSAHYPVYYKGKFSDTIKIGNVCCANFACFPQEPYYEIYDLPFPDTTRFELFVDTSKHLIYKDDFKSFDRKKEDRIIDSTRYYKAYAIFVYNLSDTLLYAGSGNRLSYVYMEYLNQNGVWAQANKFIPECPSSLRDFVLLPREIMVAKYIRNDIGKYTKCRLVWDYNSEKVYSNVFYDYVVDHELNL